MNPFRLIVGLALLPRALRTLWLLATVVGVGTLLLVVPAMCAARPGSSSAPPILPSSIADRTRQLEQADPAEPLCIESNATETCCPAGCAAKRGQHWDKADKIFRACVKAYGCEHVDGWTVFMRCDCSR